MAASTRRSASMPVQAILANGRHLDRSGAPGHPARSEPFLPRRQPPRTRACGAKPYRVARKLLGKGVAEERQKLLRRGKRGVHHVVCVEPAATTN